MTRTPTTGGQASNKSRTGRRRPPVDLAALVLVAVLLGACTGAGLGAAHPRPTASTSPTGTATTVPATTATATTPTTPPLPLRDVTMRPGTIVTPGRNLPDPFVLRLHGGYELYVSQTGVNSEQLPTSFSSRFGGWTHFTSALPKAPLWAVRGFTWAPDVRRIEGVYVMYFNALAQKRLYFDPEARGLSARAQCIGAATARRAAGPFVARARPLICDFAGHGAIDPRTFVRRGRLYLDWKSDNNAGSPAPFPPTQLYAERLTADGLSLAGPPHLLLEADAAWQQEIVEAPDMIAWHGHYWLFYSGSWYNQPSYGIGVASCATPVGPCRDLSRLGPLIGSSEEGEGPGEESALAVAPGRWWLLYAPWFDGYAGRRRRPIAVTPLGIGVDGPRPDERG